MGETWTVSDRYRSLLGNANSGARAVPVRALKMMHSSLNILFDAVVSLFFERGDAD